MEFGLCETLGYLILYTFLAFMFWINAMAANIFFRFSASMPQDSDDGFTKYFVYSQVRTVSCTVMETMTGQGTPLLVVVCVYLVDQYGPCHWVLPNMGTAHCYLGNTWNTQRMVSNGGWTDFLKTPEFIYKHSIILVLEIFNFIFFSLTIHCLIKHWRSTAQLLNTQAKMHFGIIFKLFLITGKAPTIFSISPITHHTVMTGIPWIGVLFSNLIVHKHMDGPCQSFIFIFLFDLCPLLTVVIFLTLVFSNLEF